MSPSNRRNPDRSTQLGAFGWDVLPGLYQVSATHAHCTAARSRRRAARTKVLPVPPPVVGLDLVLRCPRLHRARSHTRLKAKKVPVGEVVLEATVRGRHPLGLIRFAAGRQTLGIVSLSPRSHTAVLTVARRSGAGVRATYEGDGYNAPSSASS
jgi:hypothetical protein